MSSPILFTIPQRYTLKEKLKIIKEIDASKSPRTVRQILGTHGISTEELASWRNALENYGPMALRATRRYA